MKGPHGSRERKKYHVRVGHAMVTVHGSDESEAIGQARRRLAREMPQLWDVIHRLDDKQFRVDLVP